MSADTTESSQRHFLRRILAEGAERVGATLSDCAAAEVVFGWRDRTIGAPVAKDGQRLWLRATGEHRDWATAASWTGNRDAAALVGIPKPAMVARAEWEDDTVVNCAELMTYVPDRTCSATPELRESFDAPDAWWADLRRALDTLSFQSTDRGAQNRDWYTPTLRVFFGAKADHLKPGWATEHMDVQWSNITAPEFWLLDWESWGRAPAGYGAASLYCHSLLVPETARRVHGVFADISPYQEHLAQRIATGHLNMTLLPRFDPGLRSLLLHPALTAIVVPSRAEPFGRIPLEAFLAGAAPVVATTAGGLAELVTDQTGYPARPADPTSLAHALHAALAAGTGDRARLRAAGRRLASTHYNYEQTVRAFLGHVAPWATGPASA